MSSIPNQAMPHAYAEPEADGEQHAKWLTQFRDWGKEAASFSQDYAKQALRWGRREPRTAAIAVGGVALAAAAFGLGRRLRRR